MSSNPGNLRLVKKLVEKFERTPEPLSMVWILGVVGFKRLTFRTRLTGDLEFIPFSHLEMESYCKGIIMSMCYGRKSAQACPRNNCRQ